MLRLPYEVPHPEGVTGLLAEMVVVLLGKLRHLYHAGAVVQTLRHSVYKARGFPVPSGYQDSPHQVVEHPAPPLVRMGTKGYCQDSESCSAELNVPAAVAA